MRRFAAVIGAGLLAVGLGIPAAGAATATTSTTRPKVTPKAAARTSTRKPMTKKGTVHHRGRTADHGRAVKR
jgi:hypothetical protein